MTHRATASDSRNIGGQRIAPRAARLEQQWHACQSGQVFLQIERDTVQPVRDACLMIGIAGRLCRRLITGSRPSASVGRKVGSRSLTAASRLATPSSHRRMTVTVHAQPAARRRQRFGLDRRTAARPPPGAARRFHPGAPRLNAPAPRGGRSARTPAPNDESGWCANSRRQMPSCRPARHRDHRYR